MKEPKLVLYGLIFGISGFIVMFRNTDRNGWLYFLSVALIVIAGYIFKVRKDRIKAVKKDERNKIIE